MNTITDTQIKFTKDGARLFNFRVEVGKYWITASIPTRGEECIDRECSGSEDIDLDEEQAKKLFVAIQEYLEMVE